MAPHGQQSNSFGGYKPGTALQPPRESSPTLPPLPPPVPCCIALPARSTHPPAKRGHQTTLSTLGAQTLAPNERRKVKTIPIKSTKAFLFTRTSPLYTCSYVEDQTKIEIRYSQLGCTTFTLVTVDRMIRGSNNYRTYYQ